MSNATSYSIQVYNLSGSLIYSNSEIIVGNPITLWNVPQATATGYYNIQITFSSEYDTESKSYTVLIIAC